MGYPSGRIANDVFSRKSLAGIINDPSLELYESERKSTPLEEVIDKMRGDIEFRVVSAARSSGQRSAVHLSFAYPEPTKAQRTVRALLARFVDANIEAGAAAGSTLFLLNPPSLPVKPSQAHRYMIMALGLLAGVSLAGIAKVLAGMRAARAA